MTMAPSRVRARLGPVAANPYPWPYDGSVDTARVALICAKYAAFGIIPLPIPPIFLDVPIPIERIPKHKGTEHLRADIKTRIKELTEALAAPAKGGARTQPATASRWQSVARNR